MIGVDTTGTATGAANPDYFDFFGTSPGMVDIFCTIDCAHLVSIPAGTNTLVKIIFQVDQSAPSGATLLDLKNVTGPPPFWGNLLDYAVGKVYPTLVDGNFTVLFKCGDANGDGIINIQDVVYLINFKYLIPPGPAPKPLAAGDVNCDGIINIQDVVYLINFKYLIPPGPPPCGL